MATNYPTSVDTFTNPAGTDDTATVSHASQHDNANDAIHAVEAELGALPKGSYATVRARLDNTPSTGLSYAIAYFAFNP